MCSINSACANKTDLSNRMITCIYFCYLFLCKNPHHLSPAADLRCSHTAADEASQLKYSRVIVSGELVT